MQPAEPGETRGLKPWDGAEDLGLRGVLQLRLETDKIVERAERIVLAELHDRMGLLRRVRIGQPDRLHRPEPQGLQPPLRHDLYGQAAIKIGGVALPLMELRLGAVQERLDEALVLGLVHRTVDVGRLVAAGPFLVVAGLSPGHAHVNAVGVGDRRDGVEEG